MKSNGPIGLILVDGLHPDALAQADVPNLNKLIKEGIYSLNVRTVIRSPKLTPIYTW